MERDPSQSQKLLEMVAVSGEYSVKSTERLIPKEAYRKRLISTLSTSKHLNIIYKHQFKGYRLTSKAKKILLEENRERFESYLEGTVETNQVRYDLTRRKRLQNIGDVLTTMYLCGFEIYKDRKQDVFSQSSQSLADERSQPLKIGNPMFYLSREIKGTDQKWTTIRGSSSAGTLLGTEGMWVVYNTGEAQVEWRKKIELRTMASIQNYLLVENPMPQYKGMKVNGLMFGSDLEVLERYLTEQGNKQNGLNFLTTSYPSFYYIPSTTQGELQLKLLTDPLRWKAVRDSLLVGTKQIPQHYLIECDALTEDDKPILNCCLLDIPRLVKFQSGLNLRDKYGLVYCFDYQSEFIRRYLGERVEIKEVNHDKLKAKLYPNC